MSSEQALEIFRSTGALLSGHFILRSGLHSRTFFQCATVLQYPDKARSLAIALADQARGVACDSVISPALGGVILGQEVAAALGKRHIFVEKEEGHLVLRRNFSIAKGERFLVVEDVITRGGRVAETIDVVENLGGIVTGVAVLVDRSSGNLPHFSCPFFALVELSPETFEADQLPCDLAAIPAIKPGSK